MDVIRKLQLRNEGKTGHLQIPAEWIRDTKVQDGDYVKISTEPDGALRVSLMKESTND